MNKADKLRESTDKDLAEWISEIADCVACEMQQNAQCRYHHKKGSCYQAWLDWLQQEAGDDGTPPEQVRTGTSPSGG